MGASNPVSGDKKESRDATSYMEVMIDLDNKRQWPGKLFSQSIPDTWTC